MSKPRKPVKLTSRIKCCVKGCATRVCTGVPMHGFPNVDRFPELYQHWVDAVRLANETPFWVPLKSNKVCAFHFESVGNCRLRVPTIFPHISNQFPSTSDQSYSGFDDESDFGGEYEEDPMDIYEASIAANSIMPEDDSNVVNDTVDEDPTKTYEDIEEAYNAIVGDVVSTLVTDDNVDEDTNMYSEGDGSSPVYSDLEDPTFNIEEEDGDTQQGNVEEEIVYDDNIVYNEEVCDDSVVDNGEVHDDDIIDNEEVFDDSIVDSGEVHDDNLLDNEKSTFQTETYSSDQLGLNKELGENEYCVVVVRHEQTETQQENNQKETPSETEIRNVGNAVKRGRGRPKKEMRLETRGRPKKVAVDAENTDSPSKKKPGRPRKDSYVSKSTSPRVAVTDELKDITGLSEEVRERLLSEGSSCVDTDTVEAEPPVKKSRLRSPSKRKIRRYDEDWVPYKQSPAKQNAKFKDKIRDKTSSKFLTKLMETAPSKTKEIGTPSKAKVAASEWKETEAPSKSGNVPCETKEIVKPSNTNVAASESKETENPSKAKNATSESKETKNPPCEAAEAEAPSKAAIPTREAREMQTPRDSTSAPDESKETETPCNDVEEANGGLDQPSMEHKMPNNFEEMSDLDKQQHTVSEENQDILSEEIGIPRIDEDTESKEEEISRESSKTKTIDGVKADLLLDGEPVKLKECSVSIVKTPVKSKSKKKAAGSPKVKNLTEKIQSARIVSRPSGSKEQDCVEDDEQGRSSDLLNALSLKSSQEEDAASNLRRSARIRSGAGRRKKKGARSSWSVTFKNTPKKKLKLEGDQTSQSSESVPYDFEVENDPEVGPSDFEGSDVASDYDSNASSGNEHWPKRKLRLTKSGVDTYMFSRRYNPKPQSKPNGLSYGRSTVRRSYNRSAAVSSLGVKFHSWPQVREGDQATQVGLPGKCEGFIFDVVRDDPRNVGVSCNVFYNYQPNYYKKYHCASPCGYKRKVGPASISLQKTAVKIQNPSQSGRTDNNTHASNDTTVSKQGKNNSNAGGCREPIKAVHSSDIWNHLEEPINAEDLISIADIKIEPAMDDAPSGANVGSEFQQGDGTIPELADVKVEEECDDHEDESIRVDKGPCIPTSEVSSAVNSNAVNSLPEPEVAERHEPYGPLVTVGENPVERNTVNDCGTQVTNANDADVASHHDHSGPASSSMRMEALECPNRTSPSSCTVSENISAQSTPLIESHSGTEPRIESDRTSPSLSSASKNVVVGSMPLVDSCSETEERTECSSKTLPSSSNVPESMAARSMPLIDRSSDSGYDAESILEDNSATSDGSMTRPGLNHTEERTRVAEKHSIVSPVEPELTRRVAEHAAKVVADSSAECSSESASFTASPVPDSEVKVGSDIPEDGNAQPWESKGSRGGTCAAELEGLVKSVPSGPEASETSSDQIRESNESSKIPAEFQDDAAPLSEKTFALPKSHQGDEYANVSDVETENAAESSSQSPDFTASPAHLSEVKAASDTPDAGNAGPSGTTRESDLGMCTAESEALAESFSPDAATSADHERESKDSGDVPAECLDSAVSLSDDTPERPKSPDFSSDSSNDSFIEVPIPDIDESGTDPLLLPPAERTVEISLATPPLPRGETVAEKSAETSFETSAETSFETSAEDVQGSEPGCEFPPSTAPVTNCSMPPSEKDNNSEQSRSTREVFDSVERNLEKMFEMD